MFKIHAVSAVSRFLTSRRKSTSLYFMGRDTIACRSASPNFFFSSASQAISRQFDKSRYFSLGIGYSSVDEYLCSRVLLLAEFRKKTFSKFAAVIGIVGVLISSEISRAVKSCMQKIESAYSFRRKRKRALDPSFVRSRRVRKSIVLNSRSIAGSPQIRAPI